MNIPKVKLSSITIVGLSRDYSADEVNNLIFQNDLIKKFSTVNKLEDHFTSFFVNTISLVDSK